jgi:hypothetical protein
MAKGLVVSNTVLVANITVLIAGAWADAPAMYTVTSGAQVFTSFKAVVVSQAAKALEPQTAKAATEIRLSFISNPKKI